MIYFNFGKCRTCNVSEIYVIHKSGPILQDITPKHELFNKKGSI